MNHELMTQHEDNVVYMFIAGLRNKETRRAHLHSLNTIAKFMGADPVFMFEQRGRRSLRHDVTAYEFPWHTLRNRDTEAIAAYLSNTFAPATARKAICALRGILRRCMLEDRIEANDYLKAIDIPSVKGSSGPVGRFIKSSEFKKLIKACVIDPSPSGFRDAAIIATLYGGGFRRAELSGLRLADWQANKRVMKIRSDIAKNRKARTVYMMRGSEIYLDRWITIRGKTNGPLFCALDRHGNLYTNRKMSVSAVYGVIRKRADEAGIVDICTHDFRRTFGTVAVDHGGIETAADLMGHASTDMTRHYDQQREKRMKAAADKMELPQFAF